MGKYGLPYMGSKSAIADKIIAVLPAGKRFIDLFGGGDFDFSAFLGWAARIPCYISSYELDDSRFRIYHEFKKTQLLCATKNCAVAERLYASRYAAKEKI